MGTGIKVYLAAGVDGKAKSYPSWIRGLKSCPGLDSTNNGTSYPSRVRGLKSFLAGWLNPLAGSYPSWVRGLKLHYKHKSYKKEPSYPSWVRGLKHLSALYHRHLIPIVPFTGTGIKIFQVKIYMQMPCYRTFHRYGD